MLGRDEWRSAVIARDGTCVMCTEAGSEVHHIIERRLFPDGGYYMANGVTLCRGCHLRAEESAFTCEQLREAAGISVTLLPFSLAGDERYDKWGNALVGAVLYPGPLWDEAMAKRVIARGVEIGERRKHPRTAHLATSPGASKDDLRDGGNYEATEIVVITEKMDGECTTIGHGAYGPYCHARSLDSQSHVSQSWVRRLSGIIGSELPRGWRVVGENVQAVHSITYENLPGYFLAFAVVDDTNTFLSWQETTEWCALLGIPTVPVLWRGAWSGWRESEYKSVGKYGLREGYVVRPEDSFRYGDYATRVAKWVRAGHVTSATHWRSREIVENSLAG